MVAMIAGDLLRVAHVVEAELRVCHEVVMESERSDAEIFLVMRGEREHVVAGGQGGAGRLGAAPPEGPHGCSSRSD